MVALWVAVNQSTVFSNFGPSEFDAFFGLRELGLRVNRFTLWCTKNEVERMSEVLQLDVEARSLCNWMHAGYGQEDEDELRRNSLHASCSLPASARDVAFRLILKRCKLVVSRARADQVLSRDHEWP